ncbi:SusC/RagA family TonB-linked outer membrane protein [Limibacterium fermenti]|uniref:SusC/RagA family TonB-linked outer membrane protein n=1 Tax=Limibacterium fermenti TaxID=3229863 RepID=UPI000E9AFC62|nr:SusC/RagA family protein [Porphyromonadaceae bacterium]
MTLLFLLLVGMTSVFGQKQIVVSGKIVDELNEPMIGVNVLEKGTTNGMMTDLEGNYSLQVHEGAMIVYSYIGYITQERTASESIINITMKEDIAALEEVVVVGYGVQKRSSVTGSITSVKSEDIQNRTITNVEQALQGKTAGIQVISSSAAPGANPSIRIRGYSSNASSDPLYVVDGLRTTDISNLDPNDIESIEVLKDAASAAIYGAQAGNGVVLITTRKAKKGISRITYDFQLSSQSLGLTPKVLNAREYINYMTEGNLIPQETIDRYWDGKTDTDWMNETFAASMMQRHNINFQNANEISSLFASLSYLNNNGPIIGNKDVFDRITGTVNADYKIKDWLKFSTNNTFSRYHVQSVSEASATNSLMLSAIQLDPLTPVTYSPEKLPDTMIGYRNAGHTLLKDANGDYYSISPYGDSNNINPYIMRDRGLTKRDGFVFSGSTYLDFNPIKEIVVTSRLGYRYAYHNSYGYVMPNITCSDLYQDYVSVDASSSNATYWQWENFANYTRTFADKHNVNAMVGMSYSSNTSFGVTGGINGSRSGDKLDLGITKLNPNYAYFAYQTGTATRAVSGGEERRYANLSYFGRASYDYASKYFVQFTLRADAADLSILPLQKRWGYFPAVSAGWLLSNEKFMENVRPVSHLKLRASWGQNGSVAGLADYMYDATILSKINYPMAGDVSYKIGSLPSATGNYDLKWETSEQIDVGVDLRMLNDRLGFSGDYYEKNTKDLIVTGITPSLIVGNTVSPMNAGNVKNSGFELELSWRDNIKDFNYSVKANIATLKNKVTYLHETLERIASETSSGIGVINYFEEKYPMWYMRGYNCTGIDPQTGDPVFSDLNDDGIIGDADQTEIGSAIPDFTYGMTLTMAWKGFDFTAFGSGSHGNDVFIGYNRTSRMKANTIKEFYDGRWTKTGENSKYARSNPSNYDKYLKSSKFVFDGSYFKIKQIQLGYTLPKGLLKKTYLSNFRVYCSLDDFFTFTGYPGFDPEFTSTGNAMGLDMGSYPSSKKIVFGLNVSF